jgi:hypothetical protein
MKNRSTLFSALLRLVPLKLQRVFEHSRMRKSYRVLRRFRKKVFLYSCYKEENRKRHPLLDQSRFEPDLTSPVCIRVSNRTIDKVTKRANGRDLFFLSFSDDIVFMRYCLEVITRILDCPLLVLHLGWSMHPISVFLCILLSQSLFQSGARYC